MNTNLAFNVATLILVAIVIGVCIPNVYYFEKLYNDGGTQSMGPHSCMLMLIINIILMLIAFCLAVWSVVRMFGSDDSKQSTQRARVGFSL